MIIRCLELPKYRACALPRFPSDVIALQSFIPIVAKGYYGDLTCIGPTPRGYGHFYYGACMTQSRQAFACTGVQTCFMIPPAMLYPQVAAVN